MSIIERFCEFYSELHKVNPDDLDSIYTADIEFIDPIPTHHGLDNVIAYFSKLLNETQSCRFDIHETLLSQKDNTSAYTVIWTMHLVLAQPAKTITLDGVSIVTVRDDKIFYHRDYYDMGEMVYEHIPLLRWIIKKIKARLAS